MGNLYGACGLIIILAIIACIVAYLSGVPMFETSPEIQNSTIAIAIVGSVLILYGIKKGL
jgi:hypothetical protein